MSYILSKEEIELIYIKDLNLCNVHIDSSYEQEIHYIYYNIRFGNSYTIYIKQHTHI
jgi:hypothetical protein